MRTLCDVRPDVASMASMVKQMLEALEKHLTDFAFREMRDDRVKLRHLGRIMTIPVALCCECEPLVFEELNALRILHFETAGEELSKLGKMYALLEVSPSASNEDLRHAVRQKSAEYDADEVCDMLQRIVDAEQFLLSLSLSAEGFIWTTARHAVQYQAAANSSQDQSGGQCALADSRARETLGHDGCR